MPSTCMHGASASPVAYITCGWARWRRPTSRPPKLMFSKKQKFSQRDGFSTTLLCPTGGFSGVMGLGCDTTVPRYHSNCTAAKWPYNCPAHDSHAHT